MMPEPEFCSLFVALHKQQAILFNAIQNKMDMIVHQTEANDLDRMIRSQPNHTKCDTVYSSNKLSRRVKQNVVLQTFSGAVVEMRVFHKIEVFVGKIKKIYRIIQGLVR